MITASRKDLNEAIKWSKKNSPVAYFVLSLNGKWGKTTDNTENIVSSFKRLWPETRDCLSRQGTLNYADKGRIRPSQLQVSYPVPRIQSQILSDFFDITSQITEHLDDIEDYPFMESYCQDMIRLFAWNENTMDIWRGTLVYAMDKQGKRNEASQLYNSYNPAGPKVATIYAQALLDRVSLEDADKVLEPFREHDDKELQGRIMLLDRLKMVKYQNGR